MTVMNYLTIQDILWIHLQLVGAPSDFQYATLEEGTNYQYGLGDSQDVLGQSKRFLLGFEKLAPFPSANAATAFVGAVSFLSLNGFTPKFSDSNASEILLKIKSGELSMDEAFAKESNDHHEIDERTAILGVMSKFSETIRNMVQNSVAA